MPTSKRIIFALFGRWEGTDASQFPVGGEGVAASGENFVSVSLMSHIPDDAVIRCIEYIMQSHRELHHPQTGGKMARVAGNFFNNVLP